MKNFLISPNADNAVTLHVKGVEIKCIADHRELILLLPEGYEAVVTDGKITVRSK